ncbi:hypothetical protein QBC43DRAFT_311643 [Cladorrhinum sp. PSN259]|nr:hypothetical protein QBC43DRAFT_311643 [Cladorrhinum sp. PSN259]
MQAKSVTSSQRPKKPRKSVRFAPLPGDPIPTTMDPDAATTAFSSPYGAELSTFTTPKNQAINRPCNTFSPPPPILRTEPLPSANEKFGKHFAKVTVKQQIGIRSTPSSSLTPTNITTAPHLLRSQRKAPHLLPSESQQNCASPAVDAMAEAFLTADNIHLSSHSSSIGTDDGTVKIDIEAMVSGRDPDESIIIPHGDDRGRRHAREEEQPPSGVSNSFVMQEEDVVMQEEGVIDDVSAVLENLDDFLGQSWDLDADIARVRADDKMRGGSNSSERASWAGGGMGLDLDLDLETGIGIGMDEEAAAVWDRE